MIPDEWRVVRFAEIADYKAGRTPARANPEYWDGAGDGVPWVAISDMTEFGTVTATKEKISRAAFEHVFRSQTVRAGTLIMSFKLTIGRVATLGVDACHNEAIISIYPKPDVDQRYLGYFLAQVDYDALQDRQVKGNTLNQEKIDRIEVLLPSLDEQSSIANVLDLLRHSIDLQDRALATAEDLKRSAMRELFTRGLRGEPQKETEIGPVPESWRIQEFSETVVLQRGFDLPVSVRREGHVIVYGSNGPVGTHHESPSAVPTPTVMVGRSGSVGKVQYSDQSCWPLNTTLYVADYRGNNPKFVFYWLEHLDLSRYGQGVSVPTLNRNTFASVKVMVPTIDEQREIVAILDAIDRKIELHRKKRGVLEELFKALLHKLMTGEIRVADLDLSALEPLHTRHVAA